MELNKVKAKRSKLKGLFLASCLLFLASISQAQTFAEWFKQGSTQIKYLGLQIAALAAFENSTRQGYNMLKGEWGLIGSFKDGELTLHQNYYTSLSQVNPLVKNSVDSPAIQSEQQSIISQFNGLAGVNGLTADEHAYIQAVQQNLISECNKDMADLQNVLTPGQMVMSDDERIKRISKISEAIKDKYVFASSFCAQVRLLAAQRNGEVSDGTAVGRLYGINPN